MFQVGTKRKLFLETNIPYGTIYLEGFKPALLNNLKDGCALLEEAVANGVISKAQSNALFGEMVRAGMLEDSAAVLEKIAATNLPENFTPTVKFISCDCELGVPHGFLKNEHGSETDKIFTLQEGMEGVDQMTNENMLNPLDAINVFKSMKAADLPLNAEDADRRYEALPEDKKIKPTSVHIVTIDLGGNKVNLIDLLHGRAATRPQPSAG